MPPKSRKYVPPVTPYFAGEVMHSEDEVKTELIGDEKKTVSSEECGKYLGRKVELVTKAVSSGKLTMGEALKMKLPELCKSLGIPLVCNDVPYSIVQGHVIQYIKNYLPNYYTKTDGSPMTKAEMALAKEKLKVMSRPELCKLIGIDGTQPVKLNNSSLQTVPIKDHRNWKREALNSFVEWENEEFKGGVIKVRTLPNDNLKRLFSDLANRGFFTFVPTKDSSTDSEWEVKITPAGSMQLLKFYHDKGDIAAVDAAKGLMPPTEKMITKYPGAIDIIKSISRENNTELSEVP